MLARTVRTARALGLLEDRPEALERAFGERPAHTRPCHNDLLAENYIDDGTQLWILDFEYSGNNDPCFELGDTAQECGFDQELRAELCGAYFGDARADRRAWHRAAASVEPDADVVDDLEQELARDAQAFVDRVAAIQARISPIDYDFWGWAVERWDRAATAFDSEDFPRWIRDTAGG